MPGDRHMLVAAEYDPTTDHVRSGWPILIGARQLSSTRRSRVLSGHRLNRVNVSQRVPASGAQPTKARS